MLPFEHDGCKNALGSSSDFSPIASHYDATRDLPRPILQACYDRLIEYRLLPAHGRVLDAGCGTGQVSLPLAERGYEVVGIDISAEMIKLARFKLGAAGRARYYVGDVRHPPFAEATFDAAVVSKLFQHVENWQRACRQLIRVLRPGSHLIQINERGAFGNSVRLFFSKQADELGCAARYLGVDPHSRTEIMAFMASQGCDIIPIEMPDLRWQTSITYGEAINRINDRLYAEFWYLPSDIHERLIKDTIAWIEAQPNGRDTVDHLTPRLAVEVFRTPAL